MYILKKMVLVFRFDDQMIDRMTKNLSENEKFDNFLLNK